MLTLNYTQEILGLQDVEVEKVENSDNKQRIYSALRYIGARTKASCKYYALVFR